MQGRECDFAYILELVCLQLVETLRTIWLGHPTAIDWLFRWLVLLVLVTLDCVAYLAKFCYSLLSVEIASNKGDLITDALLLEIVEFSFKVRDFYALTSLGLARG